MTESYWRVTPWYFFFVTICLQLFLTFTVLDPKVGFDDANITQVYARNLAEGHGFVYNVGGERVEGSTSLVWTLLNSVMFLTPYPIPFITALCLFLTAGTLTLSGRICRNLGGSNAAISTTYLLFNLFPGFFAWSFWALMDITLWIFGITAMVWAITKSATEKAPSALALSALLFGAATLPLVRPEGIAFVLAVAIFVSFFRGASEGSWRIGPLIGGLGFLSILAATIWRLWYFGYPVPNTFYAKTSTDLLGQLKSGISYLMSFLREPASTILLTTSGLGIAQLFGSKLKERQLYGLLVTLLALGGFSVYTILGGDHFGSHRFFLFLLPLCIPIVSILLTHVLKETVSLSGKIVAIGVLLVYTLLSVELFYRDGGGIRHELRIAENNRQVGMMLAELPGLPTLATIPAGGIKMTYPGIVYDVLGLNWTTMAHSSETNADLPKNHGGFNADVFFAAQPELAFPRLGGCLDAIGSVEGGFGRLVTQAVTDSDVFRRIYIPMCSDTVVVYAAQNLVADLESLGFRYYPVDGR